MDWVDSLVARQLDEVLCYTSVVGKKEQAHPLWFALLHFFNHQTHHRGQVTDLVKQAGYEPGVTDLLWLPGGAD